MRRKFWVPISDCFLQRTWGFEEPPAWRRGQRSTHKGKGKEMGLDRAALLNKMAKASIAGANGDNARDGKYRFIVKRLAIEDGFKGVKFVAELLVKTSAKVQVVSALDSSKVLEVQPNAVGDTVKWMQMLEKHEGAMDRVRGFIYVLYGETQQTMDDAAYLDTLDLLTGGTPEQLKGLADRNPACGMEIAASTRRTMTKKGEEIVALSWETVKDAEERQDANRALLEAGINMAAEEVEEAPPVQAVQQVAVQPAPVQQVAVQQAAPAAVVAQAAPSRFARLAAKAAAK
jgi:hypothetical protein